MEAASHTRTGSRRQHRTMRTEAPTDQDIGDIGNGGFPGDRTKQKKPLNFYQAMSDFQTMFPHIDKDVIETVLRANDGVVQTTIDQLLLLSESTDENDGQQQTDGPRLPNYHESQTYEDDPPPAYSEIENQLLNDFASEGQGFQNKRYGESQDTYANRRTEGSRNWNPPLLRPLPADFLRLSGNPAPNNSGDMTPSASSSRQTEVSGDGFLSDKDLEQFLEDEKLATFLQNEEFMRQLRRDPDFLMSLEEDHKRFVQSEGNASSVSTGGALTPIDHTPRFTYTGGARPRHAPINGQEDPAFNKKLRHMGKTTRKKFGKLAKKFSRKKQPKFNPLAASTANLLEDSDEDNATETGLDGIQEDNDEDPLEQGIHNTGMHDSETTGGRKLPQVPSGQSKANTEPIVFYSEDNEFNYKSD